MTAWIDALQWPAMALTVLAAWFVGAESKRRRSAGFWIFLLSNAVWIVWALPAHAYALAVLQVCLAVMNIRGVRKAERGPTDTAADQPRSNRNNNQTGRT